MELSKALWANPLEYLLKHQPDAPIIFFSPEILQTNTKLFLKGFPGTTTYAVKANPASTVLANLVNAGINTFDVASPKEMDQVRTIAPNATLHYNNPVRSLAEITHAVSMDVASYSVDSHSELTKLAEQVPTTKEIAVRFKLPVSGAAYDFGSKFGMEPEQASILLKRIVQLGYTPSITFHPGTQCTTPGVWEAYIHTAAKIAHDAGVVLKRLNVGGGFPSHRLNEVAPQHQSIFDEINTATKAAFGQNQPALICEPGRAIVGDAYCLATRVKAIRDGIDVFLNDGIYGGLSEYLVVGSIDRMEVFSPNGTLRNGPTKPKHIFGPTCDSIDKLYHDQHLPSDMAEADYIIFQGLGAYSTTLATNFNGYGVQGMKTVKSLITSQQTSFAIAG